MDPYFVKFPLSTDNKNITFISVRRPITMPLKEMHGEYILTMGYDNDTKLMAIQYVDSPHKINYVYPIERAMYETFINEFNKEVSEKELSDFVTSNFIIVEEQCMMYENNHRPVKDNLKYSS